MKTRLTFILSLILLFFYTSDLKSEIKVPSIFSSNMMLQRNAMVNIWGTGIPAEKVTIETSWDNQLYKTIVNRDCKWSLQIATPERVSNATLTIKGNNNEIIIDNILVGEVWLCTGQSNMEFPVAKSSTVKWKTGMFNEEEEMKDADFPEIRLFHISHQISHDTEQFDCEGEWLTCNPENLKDFSAIGYVFAKELYQTLHVPVGMIQSTFGGTHAESWMKKIVMQNDTLYNDVLIEFHPDSIKRKKDICKVPSTLWNGMIAPIAGFTVAGNIWYQGESNSIRYQKYQQVFTDLINSWREEWGQPNMPFYFVQIAPHYGQPAGIREAQLKTWQSDLKNIGMVVVTDAADSTDIHPRYKREPGERLAGWALAKQYGKNNFYAGPLFKKMTVKGNKATLAFDFVDNGLTTPNNEPVNGFFIAGEDQRFYPALAVIDGKKLIVTAPEVEKPVAVRYGYGKFFRVNLYNNSGFPAVPFRTDSFSEDSYARMFADSEMRRFPKAYQLDHGKRLFFGYAQGVGACAMLDMWKLTNESRYFDYIESWADSLINEKGEIHLYDVATYNLDFINPGKVLFDLYQQTGKKKYKSAMDLLIKQLKNHPRTLEGGYWHKLKYQHQMWLDGLYMASPFMAQYGATFNQPEWIDEAVKQFQLCHKYTYDKETGLYYHAWDESKTQQWANKETGLSPNFWGRSIGWYFMG